MLPKDLRTRLHLTPGSQLQLLEEGPRIVLEPIAESVPVSERDGLLVVDSTLVGEWVDHRQVREERLDKLIGDVKKARR